MTLDTLPWTIEQMREQQEAAADKRPLTLLLKNCRYLDVFTKTWQEANIWIYQDRIIYTGDLLPETEAEETADMSGFFTVPGYIEPHVHPYQLYNPVTLGEFAAGTGTSVLVCDNLVPFMMLDDDTSFCMIADLEKLPASYYWWTRFDPQTLLRENPFSRERVEKWLQHPRVVQGGELTAWPDVLRGDDEILGWMKTARSLGKPVEGHLPGASERTLANMMLMGINGDHESLTADDVLLRQRLGLQVTLRYSSIRPDLPEMISELVKRDFKDFDQLMMTTDGATPDFTRHGLMDACIKLAIESGVSPESAYVMATRTPAQHFGLERLHGMIAPGRIAHLNFLTSQDQPIPARVLAKGKWVKQEGKAGAEHEQLTVDINDYFKNRPLSAEWKDISFSPAETGIEMIDAVITKPYQHRYAETEKLEEDEHHFFLIDPDGKWHQHTIVKGFATNVDGFASSFSSAGDLIVIGKDPGSMALAFNRMKEDGGIVLAEKDEIIAEIKLPVSGWMSDKPLEALAAEEKELTQALKNRGYKYRDPIYSLLFFSSTHLPYIRATQKGLYEVIKQNIVHPPNEKF